MFHGLIFLHISQLFPLQDIGLRRGENKTVGNHTSAYPTSVSRDHPVSVPTSNTNPSSQQAYGGAPIMKQKQQAVVSPFTRGMSRKKVNIDSVVHEFSYSNEPEAPQVIFFIYGKYSDVRLSGKYI